MKRIARHCILVASGLLTISVHPLFASHAATPEAQVNASLSELSVRPEPDIPEGEILGAKYTPVYLGPVSAPLHFTHTVDTGLLENMIEGRGYDCWYRFSVDRKMLLVADHAGSEVQHTSLFLYNYNPEYCLEWQIGHESIETTRPLWEPYEALLSDEIRTILDSGYGRAFLCCILQPGEYHVISEGTSLNGANNGVITTHIHLLDFPGSTYDTPHEFGTHDRDFTAPPKTFDAADYAATYASDRTARIIGHVTLQSETTLYLQQKVDVDPHYGTIPDVESQLYLQDATHNTIRTGHVSDPAEPNNRVLSALLAPGEYYTLTTLCDTTARVTLEMEGVRKREPGYGPDQPIDLGTLRPDTTARAVNDTHDFAGNYTQTCNRIYYAFSLPTVSDVILTTVGSPLGATLILLSDAAGSELNDTPDVSSSADTRGAHTLTGFNLPAGRYLFSVEGTEGNGTVTTAVTVSEPADPVPEPEEFTLSHLKNYILTVLPNRMTPDTAPGTRVRDARYKITYFDRLGRPEQTVLRGASPSKRDLVSTIEYDPQGMEHKRWLPADHPSTGKFVPLSAAQSAAAACYSDDSPYSEALYEPSPLRLTVLQYGPGAAWRAADRAAATEYLLNTSAPPLDCRLFTVEADALRDRGRYAPGTLAVRKDTDEDGHVLYTFTDLFGRTVLERRSGDDGPLDTYYVYDVRGDLRFVLPPALSALSDIASGLDDYAFRYRYDAWHRPVASKMPGAAWLRTLYDASGQMLFTQTGEQRLRDEWTFSVRDIFGRPAVSGIYSGTLADGAFADARLYVVRDTTQPSGYALQGATQFTLADIDCRIVNYYDDYAHLAQDDASQALAFVPDSLYGTLYPNAKGLPTGSVVSSPDGGFTQCSAIYYDDRKRPIQTRTRGSDGSEILLLQQYDFAGNPTVTREVVRPAAGAPADTLLVRRKYDHFGRLLRTVTSLDGGRHAVVNYAYDELGRLRNTSFGEGADTLRLHDRYNLRGWLTRRESRLFSLSLAYESPSLPSSVPSYTGNISEWRWQHGPDHPRNTYAFGYDALSRLTETRQFIDGNPDDRFVERGMTYDANGNLLTLERLSGGAPCNAFVYTYVGNRLSTLADGSRSSTFAYDADGNRTRDGLHGLDISYNRLNRIEKITRNGATLANYSYLSDGTKLAATDAAGDGLRYIGSLVYRKQNGNLALESATVDGGRIVATQTPDGKAFLPRYHIADHLGSVRAVVGPGGEVLQQSDYYPFGLRHENPDLAASDNRYGYNGKERQEFLASPYIDYGARQYDPVEARWFNPDPIADIYYSISPYAFCANNPIFLIDPDGKRLGNYYDRFGNFVTSDNIDDNTFYIANDNAIEAYEREYSVSQDKSQAIKQLKKGAEKVDGIIRIIRDVESTTYTHGEFIAIGPNGFNGFTMERPGPPTYESGKSKPIPTGEYDTQPRKEGDYANAFAFRIYNEYVPLQRGILGHVGNYPSNSTGCVLFGMENLGKGAIGRSKEAMENFRIYFQDKNKIKLIIR